MDLAAELDRRHANIRIAMGEHGLDALIVSGNEYSGFEGAVTYVSGFQIVHRYAYVVIPADGEPFIVFPTEARYVGEHGTTPLEQVFHARPGEHIAAHARDAGWKRVGVYGLDYIMAVRDYAALDGLDLVGFDVEFDLARAVKSDAELDSVRDSVRINQRGFELWHEAYAPGKTAAEVMAAAEEFFIAEGCGRLTMNMVLTGTDSFARPEFKIARSTDVLQGFVLPSLEVAGPGMHWVEVSRAVRARDAVPSDETKRMLEGYIEYYDAAKGAMHAGATCHDVHIAVSKGFSDRYEQFREAGYEVIGVSIDSAEKNDEFRSTCNLAFPIHSDEDAALTTDIGVLKDYGEYGWLARRVTFLLDANGVVQQVWDVTDAEAHPDEVLATVS